VIRQQSSTRCVVRVIAPNGIASTFRSQDANAALLAVETTKHLEEACGSFTLHFAPGLDRTGRRWDQAIPKRSLVIIDMERLDDTDDAIPTVMLGLTDDHSMQEDYTAAQPRRQVAIHGRELSCVIVDAVLWFDKALASHPEYGVLTVQTLPDPQTGLAGEARLALAHDPNMARANEDPRETLARILNVYLFLGGKAVAPSETPDLQQPVISLDLPIGTLADLLSLNAGAWSLFEDGVTVPIRQHPAQTGSLWNYLHVYIDRAFQEFFTRIEDGVCKIHFRGKPFLHTLVTSGTRFKSTGEPGDTPSSTIEPTLQTLELDPADILTMNLHTQTANVYNVFKAGPRGISALYKIPEYTYQILPQIIVDPRHPSFVGRYGLRVLEVDSPYLSPLDAGQQVDGQARGPAAPVPLTPKPASAGTYPDMANQIAAAHQIPPNQRPYFVALMHQESSFNPNATHKNSNGTVDEGIAQFHRPYPTGVTLNNPFDPVEALGAAAQYWNILRGYPWIGDDPVKIVAAYNGGPTGTQHGFSPAVQRHVAGVQAKVPLYQGYAGASTAPPPAPTPPVQNAGAGGAGTMITTAQRWAAILRAWYDVGGELFGGVVTVRGHPGWNIGHRVRSRDQRGEWEAYIEGVGHRYDMRSGQYTTTVHLTRGWYLADAIIQQMREDGQTTIDATSGGPPEIDPATGERVTAFGLVVHGKLPR
jgi:hypothetical protein